MSDEKRTQYNSEIILQNEAIVLCIKFQRIIWFGHIQGMEDSCTPKRILKANVFSRTNINTYSFNTRRRKRPKLRRNDYVADYVRNGPTQGIDCFEGLLLWRPKSTAVVPIDDDHEYIVGQLSTLYTLNS